jgi:acylphosphatase
MIRRHAIVKGDVQGVFFRDSTRDRAQSRGVAGWVTNRPDGSVEAVFEGEADAVESMLRFVKEGPRRAEVRDVEITEEEPGGLQGFEVR